MVLDVTCRIRTRPSRQPQTTAVPTSKRVKPLESLLPLLHNSVQLPGSAIESEQSRAPEDMTVVKVATQADWSAQVIAEPKSAVLHRHLHHSFLSLARGQGSNLILQDGRKIFDASGGAAVACIGHGDGRVVKAAMKQMSEVAYCATIFYTTNVYEELCQFLVNSTRGHMARAYIVNSGSEAMEAAMKLARQYFLEKSPPEPCRTRFISRDQSYHGITIGSLSMGGHKYRREKFQPLLLNNVSKVSPCFPYRNQYRGESDQQYVDRLAAELDEEFQRVGGDTVCAFVAEPVVGAALGCVPAVPGYFKAMQAVCDKYGALLIFDEVMSGMGRTGTLHAWEQEGVVPDIQTIGKCLGGGYQPVAGVLANHRVMDAFEKGTATFVHGHTYQGHPVGCAAALEVQRIIKAENLIQNVDEMGRLLLQLLRQKLGKHPNVGDIRGRGLFWGIEFVADKATGTPFPAQAHVAMEISEMGLAETYGIAVYPGSGTVDGTNGDHIILSPPYNVGAEDVRFIADTVARLVEDFFADRVAA